VLGIAIWGEWPDVWSLAGVAVLIASGLYIWHREVEIKSFQRVRSQVSDSLRSQFPE
jgi:drug/metabolite transporter (DMT)-like permease